MAIGETLKNAREALGLSHKDVAESTHMMTQMVREIEEEDYHRFTAPVYGKGFIKLFAKAVGLDPAPLVAEYLANLDGKNDTRQKTFVPLETIDTEPGGGIRTVMPAGMPQPSDNTPPPAPRHTYARASAVTLPKADSPYAINTQTPPPPRQPVPTIPTKLEPVKPRPPVTPPTRLSSSASSEDSEIIKPRSTADDVHNASTFKLEADSVASGIPPQPVAQAREPFKFPSAAKRPARIEPEEIPERPVQPKKVKPPRIRNEGPKGPSLVDVCKHLIVLSGNALKSTREKLTSLIASGDEEESQIRKHYILTGILVFVIVLVVIIIAASSSGSGTGNGKDKDAPHVAKNEVVEPVVVDTVVNPVEPLPVAGPATPVEIVRVLPPPKMFAK